MQKNKSVKYKFETPKIELCFKKWHLLHKTFLIFGQSLLLFFLMFCSCRGLPPLCVCTAPSGDKVGLLQEWVHRAARISVWNSERNRDLRFSTVVWLYRCLMFSVALALWKTSVKLHKLLHCTATMLPKLRYLCSSKILCSCCLPGKFSCEQQHQNQIPGGCFCLGQWNISTLSGRINVINDRMTRLFYRILSLFDSYKN